MSDRINDLGQRGYEVDVKRLFLPFEVFSTCPGCGQERKVSLLDHYLSYPDLDNPEPVHFMHDHNDEGAKGDDYKLEKITEWIVWVKLTLKLELTS